MVFQHLQRLFAEAVDYQRGGCGAYALYGAAREVGVDGLCSPGQAPLRVFRLELPTVVGVGHPLAKGVQLLAGTGRGQSSNHGRDPAVERIQPEHGVAVLLVGVDDAYDPARELI